LLLLGGFLAVVGLAKALSIAGVLADIDGADAESFRNGQITLLVWGAPLLGLAAAAVHWSPKLSGRPLGGATLIALMLVAGVVLMSAPSYIAGFGGDSDTAVVGSVGAALTAAGLLMMLGGLARPATAGPGDPYGGLTLEWSTASPPPPHNLHELPEIDSPYPLVDAGQVQAGAERDNNA
ncbi:MAG: hypothetical protein ACRD0M_12180, partial [Acidimicrobiales bacterium]